MSTLSVWRFNTPDGAEKAVNTLERLSKQQLITVHDAATVSWPADAKKPKTRQLHNLAGAGALGGAFWGMLFGLLFLVPLLGAAIGAAAGALVGTLSDVGIDDEFIKRTRDQITPGTSALFVLTSDAVRDKVQDAFAGQRADLLFTNLSKDQEDTLREAFAE
ncbi:DUF1269 domain-containing protein [Pseudonocardia sp. DSM 110487]|uniref:DUF1269 domain-containing protein n=1 Tax=Pseudonocardia sp. DSM 110487 TaxID=2865833 RepID=UPI001C69DED0|nr:DUF1269 domain-containing protein [Pseudonocardia sp. DSM 110487]QYN38588.1 DUF1269 domain-containing protein [Pseudonocardia sp. DSM 110487]